MDHKIGVPAGGVGAKSGVELPQGNNDTTEFTNLIWELVKIPVLFVLFVGVVLIIGLSGK